MELVHSPCHQNGHCHVEEEVEDPCDQQRDHPVQGEGGRGEREEEGDPCDQQRDHPVQGEGGRGEREEEGDPSSKLLPAADKPPECHHVFPQIRR